MIDIRNVFDKHNLSIFISKASNQIVYVYEVSITAS